MRETSHTVNVNESTWVIVSDKETLNTICVFEHKHVCTIGIYKISRDRSLRETSHTVNDNESTWVIVCDKETLNMICVSKHMHVCTYAGLRVQG